MSPDSPNQNEFFYSYSADELDIIPEDIIQLVNADYRADSDAYFSIIAELLELIPPNHEYRSEMKLFSNISFMNDYFKLKVENIVFSLSEVLYKDISESVMVSFFVCTAGDIFTDISIEFSRKEEYLKAYLVDLAGNIAVGKLASRATGNIMEKAGKMGMKATNYYCPGNCGWDLNEQRRIFKLLSGEFAGVRLNDNNMMSPMKSISGLIGIGRNIIFRENTCELCSNKSCIYRDISYRRIK